MRNFFSRIKGKIFPTVFGLVFFTVGAALFGASIKSIVDTASYPSATATVISAKVYYDSEGELLAVSTYEYYVDGQRYEGTLGAESANGAKLEGATFKVKYNPDDPSKSIGRGSVVIVTLLFGLVFGSVGAGIVIAVFCGKLN